MINVNTYVLNKTATSEERAEWFETTGITDYFTPNTSTGELTTKMDTACYAHTYIATNNGLNYLGGLDAYSNSSKIFENGPNGISVNSDITLDKYTTDTITAFHFHCVLSAKTSVMIAFDTKALDTNTNAETIAMYCGCVFQDNNAINNKYFAMIMNLDVSNSYVTKSNDAAKYIISTDNENYNFSNKFIILPYVSKGVKSNFLLLDGGLSRVPFNTKFKLENDDSEYLHIGQGVLIRG